MEPAACLVCEKGLAAETLLISAARLLCSLHIPGHLEGLLIPLGPPTHHHPWSIGVSGALHCFSLDAGPRLAARAQGIQAKGLAFPRRHGALGCAARIAPPRILERLLQRGPIALPVAEPHHGGPLREAHA